MLLKLQFIFKMFPFTLKKRISKKSLGKDFGKIIHNQKRPNNNNNLPTKTQVLQLLLTLKNAAVEPPCTAPYLIFCCLKCLDLKFKVQFIWHKNSDLATMKSFPNFGEKESGLLFFLNSSGDSDRVAQWRPICRDGRR